MWSCAWVGILLFPSSFKLRLVPPLTTPKARGSRLEARHNFEVREQRFRLYTRTGDFAKLCTRRSTLHGYALQRGRVLLSRFPSLFPIFFYSFPLSFLRVKRGLLG